jgi:hypothetical protein
MYSFGRDKLAMVDIRSMNIHDNDYACFCFGEIDCRCHIHKYKETWRENIIHLVDNYIDAINQNARICPNIKIIIQSVTPAANTDSYKSTDIDYPHLGTNVERVTYTTYLNSLLKQKCAEHGYIFLDVHDNYATSEGLLNDEYSDKEVHIRDPRFIIDFIKNNLQ